MSLTCCVCCVVLIKTRCYEQLVRLKKKYPDRVVLLVGNRDVNKMRFTSELDDSEMDFDTMARGAVPYEVVSLSCWNCHSNACMFFLASLVYQRSTKGQPGFLTTDA